MSGLPSRTLAVVEVTRQRPERPAYHAYVEMLNARMQATAEDAGWSAARFAAADLGTAALLAATADADAIVIVGGEDVAPEWYGAARGYADEGAHAEVADEAQIAVVHRALARRTPLLGVCRGLQIINVALGGTLVQDLGDDSVHRNAGAPVERLMHAHDVSVVPGSALAEALGASGATVQSAHHQAVATPAAGLVVTARASDGVVEAVEHADAPIVAVQWHPEDPGAPEGQLEALLGLLDAAVATGALAQGSALPLAA